MHHIIRFLIMFTYFSNVKFTFFEILKILQNINELKYYKK